MKTGTLAIKTVQTTPPAYASKSEVKIGRAMNTARATHPRGATHHSACDAGVCHEAVSEAGAGR
jgi:hypothetical protein